MGGGNIFYLNADLITNFNWFCTFEVSKFRVKNNGNCLLKSEKDKEIINKFILLGGGI